MITDALSALIDRHSLGIRYLAEPGPSAQQLLRMAEAALHAPDHAELTPFRFKAISGDARARLAQLFEYAAREGGKDEAGARLDVERALKAPVTVAFSPESTGDSRWSPSMNSGLLSAAHWPIS